jgi:hypothetical protein
VGGKDYGVAKKVNILGVKVSTAKESSFPSIHIDKSSNLARPNLMMPRIYFVFHDKVLDNAGSGYNSDILEGIDYVVRAHANSGRNSIMSMSVGGAGDSQAMSDSIENAWYSGVFTAGT